MKIFAFAVPVLFCGVFLYAAIKKVTVYDSFVNGAKGAIPLLVSIFPYVACILVMTELFEVSGLADLLIKFLSPFFTFLGIPEEIVSLVLIKPFSGSGSTALLSEILSSYGADSYIARCACACYGSSETVFYVAALYFSTVKKKNLLLPVLISLVSVLLSTVFACFLCRVMPI